MDKQVNEFLGILLRGAPYGYYWTPQGEQRQGEDGGEYWVPLTRWFRANSIPNPPPAWKDRNVFFGVHPTGAKGNRHQKGKIATVGAVNCVFGDFDLEPGEDPLEALSRTLDRVPFRPSVIVSSGGGWHLYWILDAPLVINGESDREQARLLQYAWQELVGSDSNVKDLARVLRLPGSFNHKPEFAPDFPEVRFHQYAPGLHYTLADIVGKASGRMEAIRQAEQEAHKRAQAPAQPVGLDDQELVAIIRRSKNGPEFDRLFAGDLSAHGGDHSRADMAMCNLLAYWTARDKAQMDRIMRASGLHREKWDRGDYAERTLSAACDTAQKVFTPGFRNEDEAVRQAEDLAATTSAHHAAPDPQGTVSDSQGTASSPQAGAGSGGRSRGRGNGISGNGGGSNRPDYAALGAAFVGRHSDYIYARSAWHHYENGVWQPQHDLTVERLAWDFLADLGVPASIGGVQNLLSYARSHVFKKDDELDADADLINLQNGTYHLGLGALLTHNPDHLLTTQLPFSYDLEAACPLWQRYLETTFLAPHGETDWDLIDMISEAVGYSLTTDNSKHVAFWLYGQGANGKGVLFHILEKLGGNAAVPFNVSLLRREQYQLATLAGKRIALCPEADTNTVVEDGTIKALVAGDALQVRMIHQQPFTLHPKVKLWWAMNSLPNVTDTSEGFWRRVRLIPFRADFEKRDRGKRVDDLKERLEGELPGVFNWALCGLKRLRDTGRFTEVKQVRDETATYRSESNTVGLFVAQVCDAGAQRNVASGALYSAFKAWIADNGFKLHNVRRFKQEMQRLGYTYEDKVQGTIIFGVGIKGQANTI